MSSVSTAVGDSSRGLVRYSGGDASRPTWVICAAGARGRQGDVPLWVEGVDDDLFSALDLGSTEGAATTSALGVLQDEFFILERKDRK